jgi:glycerol-3-phosphate dehydrogenase
MRSKELILTDLDETNELRTLYNQGITNGLTTDGIALLNREQCLELEPNLNAQVLAGLLCTCSHILDPVCLTNKLMESAILNGARLLLGNKVENITKLADDFSVETINHHSQTESYRATFIINAAGHYADLIARMIHDRDFSLKARTGQYRIVEKTERRIINDHILFMAPTIYGKGVIVAPMLDGRLLVGTPAQLGDRTYQTRKSLTASVLSPK